MSVTAYQTLRPAQRIAALSALKDALDQAINVEKAAALTLAESVGVKSFSTEFGAVNIVEKDAPFVVNEFELLDWVKENVPEMVVTTESVQDWYVKQLTDKKRFTVVDGDVFDKATGEAVPYVTVGAKPPAYVSWPSSAEQKQGKEIAHSFLTGQLDNLSGAVLGLTAAPEPLPVAATPAVQASPPAVQVVEPVTVPTPAESLPRPASAPVDIAF